MHDPAQAAPDRTYHGPGAAQAPAFLEKSSPFEDFSGIARQWIAGIGPDREDEGRFRRDFVALQGNPDGGSEGVAVSTQTSTKSDSGSRQRGSLALEIGLLLSLSLIWGSSFTLIKVAIETVPPLTMTAARVTIAAMLLILVAKMRGLSFPREGAIWAAFFVQGLLQSALPFTLINWGEQHIASGLAGVLNATPPMFVLLIGMTTGCGGQRITRQKAIGALIGLAGVATTIGFQSLGKINTAAPMAQAAVLGASLCYALASMWGRRFAGLPVIVTAAGAMCCAASMMLPAAIIVERPWTLSPAPEAIAAVIVLAVLCTTIAMIIYFRLVHTLGPLGTTSGSYLRAGFAVVLGILFLGESFTWSIAMGMLLIVMGVIVVTVPLRRLGQKADASPSSVKRER